MQVREKVGKSRNNLFFQWFEAPEGRRVGSLKRRVRSQLARWEMKICTPLWREAHFEVKTYKAHQVRITFGSWDVEKVHAVVARSTCWSQDVQNTAGPDHFWKLRCRKSARRCGAKHISKSKCAKHTRSGPLLEVEMLKKLTPLWREARFEVKMYKAHQVRTTWKLRCRKSACRCGAKHISKSKCTKHLSSGSLLEVALSKKCTALWREAYFEAKMLKTPHVQMSFRVAGARDCGPCQKWSKREGFVAFPKAMAGVGHLKRIWQDAFSVAGAVQETCSSELLGGPGAVF